MEIHFKESMEAVRVLEKLAEFLKKAAEQDFAETMAEIQRGWEGETAELFLKKGGLLHQRLEQSADHLLASAEAVKRAAEKIYQAEQRAAAIARERR